MELKVFHIDTEVAKGVGLLGFIIFSSRQTKETIKQNVFKYSLSITYN